MRSLVAGLIDGLNDSDHAESAYQREAIAVCWIVIGPRNQTREIDSR